MYKDISNCVSDNLSPEALNKLGFTIGKFIKDAPPVQDKKHLCGSFAVSGVKSLHNGTVNLWCEFVAKKLGAGIFESQIVVIIIYDEIPDIVLDRMNAHMKLKAERTA